MRVIGKYLEPCTHCGAIHWQGSQTTYGEDEYGEFCKRYRICKDCGHKIQTIQRDGSEETMLKEVTETKRPRLHLYSSQTGKIKSIKAPTEEEALKMIFDGLAKIRGGK